MPEPGRYALSLSAARRILAMFGREDPHRLAEATYLILDAIHEAERGDPSPALSPVGATELVAERIARRCVRLIQGCLREEEWQEAAAEFSRVAGEELAALAGGPVHSGG